LVAKKEITLREEYVKGKATMNDNRKKSDTRRTRIAKTTSTAAAAGWANRGIIAKAGFFACSAVPHGNENERK